MDEIGVHRDKEPWLGASLSWLLPGIGHLYSGFYRFGIFLLVLFFLMYISWIILPVYTFITIPRIINLLCFIVLGVFACRSAFKSTKKNNSEDFEKERTANKDPWLAVFLSVILPGLGHIYLRKWIVGSLYILVCFGFTITLHIMEIDFTLAVIIYRCIACFHAYITSRPSKDKPKRLLILFIISLLFLNFLNKYLLPELQKQFFQYRGPMYGTSMHPTFIEGDRTILNTITYRFNDPQPGDIITFHPPKYTSAKKIPACKRIIATGGETIQIRDGTVYVDGKKRKFISQTNRDKYSLFTLNQDKHDNPYLIYGIDEPYYVPEDHYFVLGDNRQNSADSRWYGAIAREKIIGKVVKIYWPPRRMGFVR